MSDAPTLCPICGQGPNQGMPDINSDGLLRIRLACTRHEMDYELQDVSCAFNVAALERFVRRAKSHPKMRRRGEAE